VRDARPLVLRSSTPRPGATAPRLNCAPAGADPGLKLGLSKAPHCQWQVLKARATLTSALALPPRESTESTFFCLKSSYDPLRVRLESTSLTNRQWTRSLRVGVSGWHVLKARLAGVGTFLARDKVGTFPPGAGRHLAAPDGQRGSSPSTSWAHGPEAAAAGHHAPKRGRSSESGLRRNVVLTNGTFGALANAR
jgi:hypothetical protein